MKKWLAMFAFITISISFNIHAQEANFSAAERFAPENLVKMVGDRSVEPHWLYDSDIFWYRYKTSKGTNFYLVNPKTKQKIPLFDHNYMAARLTEVIKKPYNAEDLPLKNIKFKKNNIDLEFEVEELKFYYNTHNMVLTFVDSVKETTRSPRWIQYSPDSTWIVFAKNHNLYLMQTDDSDSTEIQLTSDGERWYSFAANDGDTTQNKRLRTNAQWFEDSKKLYVRRRDRRKVGELWLVHTLSEPRPTLETYKYEMPGEENVPQTELIIFDVATKERIDVDIKKWVDQNIGSTYTGKTSDKLYFTRINRPADKIDVCVVDTETGNVTVLISEESKPYFNTGSAQLHVIEDGEELIWWSEREGWGHFYLYDGEGRLKNKITSGPFLTDNIAQIDTARRIFYFVGYGRETDIDPYYQMHYSVDFEGKNLKLLTPENGTHSFSMSKSNKYFVDTYSRVDEAPVSVLRNASGNVILKLETMDITNLVASGWKKPEIFKVKAADNITDLYGVMWKPFDFDPEMKYPIISYVYPGPQTEPVPKEFFVVRNERVHNIPLAQLGFIVISVGQRGGSPLRAKWYHNYGYGNARDYPLADNKYAIEQLADKYSFIDIDRVGIYGRSGGGFMSTAAILAYPDFYDVAVSSCGNHDNNVYNRGWGEFHYGVKEVQNTIKDSTGERQETVFETDISTNPEVAKNLKGKLLLLHGEVDNNVHPANTYRLVDALVKAGKRFDLMIFPGKRHTYGEYTKYIERMMWYYFAEHLLGDYRTNTDIYMKW